MYNQRFNYPQIRYDNKFFVINWGSALNLFTYFLTNNFVEHLEVLCGFFVDLETVLSLKIFFTSFGCSNFNYVDNVDTSFDFRFSFLLNNTLSSLEFLNYVIFFGINLRFESPLMNVRLRKSFLNYNTKFYSLGLAIDYLTYPVLNLGNSLHTLKLILQVSSIIIKIF